MFGIFNRIQYGSIIGLHMHIINSSMFQSQGSQCLLSHILTQKYIISTKDAVIMSYVYDTKIKLCII